MSENKNFSITNEDSTFKIITSRPEEMSYVDYKTYMRAQKKAIKKYLRGHIVHLSKLYPTADILKLLSEKEYSGMAVLLTKGNTYIKPKEDDNK